MPMAEQGQKMQAQGQQNNKFWDFIPGTNGNPPELLLYGTISSYQSWWEDRVTPQTFNQELSELGDVPEIVVRINSPGGDVFAANAIYTRLKDHAAKITVKVDGWAASAATIIAMAGDVIKIPRNGVFMIHEPAMTVYDTFKASDFEKMAEELKVIKQSIVNAYSMKTGRDEKEIADMMAEEKWWTGDEAVDNGFCDEIMFEDAKTVVENNNKIVVNSVQMDVSGFKSLPKNIVFNSPINPGSLTNSAQTPEKKKEETKMAESTITTVEALKAEYPDLTAAIEKNATDAERARIRAINDTALDGFENIVEDAMFNNPISAEQMAMRIIAEQKKQGGTYLANRDADVKDSKAAAIEASAGEKGQEKTNPFDAAIDKMLGGNQNV